MASWQPGSGKFQQRDPGSSWSGSAAAGGGWGQLGPPPSPGDPSGAQRGSLHPNTCAGCCPCPAVPRVQDAASSPEPGPRGDEGSQQSRKEEICQILGEIQAPLSPLLLRSGALRGNALGDGDRSLWGDAHGSLGASWDPFGDILGF